MTREIQIGGEKMRFKASGALPIFYRQLTGHNFFEAIKGQDGEKNLELAWVMYRQANPEDLTELAEWLDRFGFAELYSALGEVMTMLSENMKSTSSAKKKNVS